jgi:hypothetical protein
MTKSARDGTAFGPWIKEHPMQRTHFDFDVITGSAPPRPAPKPESRPDAGKIEPRPAGGAGK